MKIIVGLGNPGTRYAGTRHNAGRMLVEYAASKAGAAFSHKKALKCFLAKTAWADVPVILAYPDVFMNLSGEAVAPVVNYHKAEISRDLLVVVDDLSLPFGQWRLRTSGSSGGHNGLKSVESMLGTSEFARLRFGVGHPKDAADDYEVSGYVLSGFFPEETAALPDRLEEGLKAAVLWATESAEKAMNAVNGRKISS